MAKNILVNTPDSLRTYGNELTKLYNEHNDTLKKTTEIINKRTSSWAGFSEQTFVADYTAAKVTIEKMRESVESFKKAIDSIAKEFESADTELANQIKKI